MMNEKPRKESKVKETALDKVISWVNPVAGMRRYEARARMAVAGGYLSGDRSRRALKSWGKSGGSADAEIIPDLDYMRSDSRDLMRKSPLARGAVNTVVTNVVGTGLRPQSRPDRAFLIDVAGLTEDQVDKFEQDAERIFNRWANRPDCDASRIQNFAGLQNLVFRAVLESGDVFAIRRYINKSDRPVTLALQIMEADRVANPLGQQDSEKFVGGIERNRFGAPMKYHFTKAHPGNRYQFNKQSMETTPIDAYMSNGEWGVLHLLHRERPEQTRGVPYLAPVVEILKQLERYTDAEIMAAVISGMFTVFITTEDGEGFGALNGDTQSDQKADEYQMGNGSMVDLRPGEDVQFANPGRPNQAFEPFVLAILRQIGCALEIPFEILIKHFTASFSASQAAIMEAWKFFRARRFWLADHFCTPCYEAVIAEAIGRGNLDAPGFFDNPAIRDAYLGVEWIGPPRGVIDPNKEVNANVIMEDRGWKTAQEITSELTGGDWDRKHSRRVKEENARRESGVAPPDGASATQVVTDPQNDNPDQQDQQNN